MLKLTEVKTIAHPTDSKSKIKDLTIENSRGAIYHVLGSYSDNRNLMESIDEMIDMELDSQFIYGFIEFGDAIIYEPATAAVYFHFNYKMKNKTSELFDYIRMLCPQVNFEQLKIAMGHARHSSKYMLDLVFRVSNTVEPIGIYTFMDLLSVNKLNEKFINEYMDDILFNYKEVDFNVRTHKPKDGFGAYELTHPVVISTFSDNARGDIFTAEINEVGEIFIQHGENKTRMI